MLNVVWYVLYVLFSYKNGRTVLMKTSSVAAVGKILAIPDIDVNIQDEVKTLHFCGTAIKLQSFLVIF